jgi:hypothetical protein
MPKKLCYHDQDVIQAGQKILTNVKQILHLPASFALPHGTFSNIQQIPKFKNSITDPGT